MSRGCCCLSVHRADAGALFRSLDMSHMTGCARVVTEAPSGLPPTLLRHSLAGVVTSQSSRCAGVFLCCRHSQDVRGSLLHITGMPATSLRPLGLISSIAMHRSLSLVLFPFGRCQYPEHRGWPLQSGRVRPPAWLLHGRWLFSMLRVRWHICRLLRGYVICGGYHVNTALSFL